MFKNVASQKIQLFAFDATTGLPKTGDAANITAYVSKDYGTVTVLGDTSATEIDSTNAKGWYMFDLTQGETNADELLFTAKSSTANISVVGARKSTVPVHFTTLVIDSAGVADANAVKVGPSGSGTAQTARDIGLSVLLSTGTGTGQLDFTAGVVKANLAQILGTALTETAGQIAAAFKKFFNIATPASTMDHLTLIDTVTTATTATNLTNAATAGDFTATMKTSIGTAVAASAVASVTGAVGSVTGAVGSVTGLTASDVGAIKAKTDNLPPDPADASDIAGAFSTVGSAIGSLATGIGAIPTTPAPSAATVAGAVWDVTASGHTTSGTTGAALVAAGSAGDPWATDLPGSYGAGTAGHLIGTNLDAAVSAVKSKTDNLPASPAAASDVPTATENADALLNRDMSAVTDSNSRSPLNALRFVRNGFLTSGSTLTILKEDDSTPAYTRTVATDSAAEPIVGVS